MSMPPSRPYFEVIPCEATQQQSLNEEPATQAVTGDIFSDLPEVHTWQMAEGAEYASKPQTPNQAWLRRAPPTTQVQRLIGGCLTCAPSSLVPAQQPLHLWPRADARSQPSWRRRYVPSAAVQRGPA